MQNQVVNPFFFKNRDAVLELLNTLPKQLKTNRKVLPNFLVLGPPKTATTSLYRYLEQHPEIYLPALKNPAFFIYEGQERNFFGRNVVNSLDAYYVLFQHQTTEKAIGEVSPGYLPDFSAPARIFKHIPQVKMITMLRNPVERAFSQFCYNKQINIERYDDFCDILNKEINIMNGEKEEGNPKYIRAGFYYRNIMRYYQFFDPSQLLVLVYDDFIKDPLNELKKIFAFLEVDTGFVPDLSIKYNITDVKTDGKSATDRGDITCKNGDIHFKGEIAHSSRLPVIPESVRDLLSSIYTDDIKSLQGILNRDLTGWLK